MKKFIAAFLSLAMLLGTMTPTFASSSIETVSNAIVKSIMSDYVQAEANTHAAYKNSSFDVLETFSSDKTKNLAKVGLELDIKGNDLAAILEELDLPTDADLQAKISGTSFIDTETGDAFGKFFDQNVSIKNNSSDAETQKSIKDIQSIIDAYLETMKIFSDQWYKVNYKELQKQFMEDMKEMEDSFNDIHSGMPFDDMFMPLHSDFGALDISKKDIAEFTRIIFTSGLFEVTQANGNTYTIKLTDSFSNINLTKVLAESSELSFIPDEIKKEMKENINVESLEFVTMMGEEIYKEVLSFLDYSMVVRIQNQKIQSIDQNIIIQTPESADMSFSTDPFLKDLKVSVTSKTSITYNTQNLSAPSEKDGKIIDITKIIIGFTAQAEIMAEKWGKQEKVYEEENRQMMIQDIAVEYAGEWFTPYVTDLAEKNILPMYYSFYPTEEINHWDAISMLENASDPLSVQLNYETELTKLNVVKAVIKTINPEVKNPIAYAIKNKIISSSNIKELKSQTINNAEFIKVLSTTLRIKHIKK